MFQSGDAMADEEKEAAIARTGEFLGIGAAGVTTVLATNPYVIGIAALFPTLGEIALKAFVRRAENFWGGVKSCTGGDEDAARERLNAGSSSPAAQDAVLETLRRVQDALDPEVVFALGRLLWPYATGERRPNRFFRSMGKLLTDIDAHELSLLTRLLRAIVKSGPLHSVRLQNWVTESVDPIRQGIGFVGTRTVLVEDVSGDQLFPILKRHGFAQGIGGFGMDPEATAEIYIMTAESILEVIDLEFVAPIRDEPAMA